MWIYLLYSLAALYLGILTSISPCPLATNIAAISYIARKIEDRRTVVIAGLLYTLGRCLSYILLGILISSFALSIPVVSVFLQKYMHLVIGPIMLLIGMFLLGLIEISSSLNLVNESMQRRVDRMGVWGSLLLGMLFAISFCPTSAAWFFGLLALIMGAQADAQAVTGVLEQIGVNLPEASIPGGIVVLPLIYGIGTALPVLLAAMLLIFSAQNVGRAYNLLARIERWARLITGWIFVLLGIGFSLHYVFRFELTLDALLP